jgi:two-component system OmpR family response regulator
MHMSPFPKPEYRVMKPRLLVVDDEESLRELYRLELEEEGYAVECAAGAGEVLGKLDTGTYEVIILDIRMPGMTGVDLLQRIAARHKGQAVILNTAHAAYQDNFLTWLADGYVVKSADITELKQAIRKALTREP